MLDQVTALPLKVGTDLPAADRVIRADHGAGSGSKPGQALVASKNMSLNRQ